MKETAATHASEPTLAPPSPARMPPSFESQATDTSWTRAEPRPLGARAGTRKSSLAALGDLEGRPIQRKKADGGEDAAQSLQTSGGGRALSDSVRPKMEQAFGTDFSDVRVHADSQAALSVSAQAFTAGSDIHFAPGFYSPGSSSGDSLIGHELTHVVQQRQGRVSTPAQAKGGDFSINADAGLEAEADALGARAARGEALNLGQVPGPGAAGAGVGQRKVIQRNPLKTAWAAVKKFFTGKKDEDESPLLGHGARADDVDKLVDSHKPKSDDKYHKLKGVDEYEDENLFNQDLDTSEVDQDKVLGTGTAQTAKKYGKMGARGLVSAATSAPVIGDLVKPVEYTLKGIAIKKTLSHRKNLREVQDQLLATPSDQWTESEQQLFAVVDYVIGKKMGKVGKLVIPGAGLYGVVKGVAKQWQGTKGAGRKTASALLLELAGDVDDAKVSTLAQQVIIDLLKLRDEEALLLINRGTDLEAIERLADKMLSS